MYSHNLQNGSVAKTNSCIEVYGNNFPEIHVDPNNEPYWVCNVLEDPNQNIHQNAQLTQRAQGSVSHVKIQEPPILLESSGLNTYTITAAYHRQYSSPNQYHPTEIQLAGNPCDSNQGFQEIPRTVASDFWPNNNLTIQSNNIHTRKPHHAHLTVVKTSNGVLKSSITKRKRKRTMFTTEQIAALEKVFFTKPYINREERQTLVEELQINDRAIKVWFQNRRLKEKREAAEAEQEMYSPNIASTGENMFRLDQLSYVESKIDQTDEYGFVTLDDRAMSDLVTVIDNILTKEPHTNNVYEVKEETENEESAVYEPISPATSESTNNEDSNRWQPFEPKESLQRLLDLQQFLVFNTKS